MTEHKPTTVLIADDEIDMRMLVRVVLESAKRGIEVVAEAVDGDHAVTSFNELDVPDEPDVVILDNRMPGRTGIEVARQMLEQWPDQKIVLFSAFLNADLQREARDLGVAACVSKEEVTRLPDVILSLLDG